MYNKAMTPQKRVLSALRGGMTDRVPFTVYECMLPQCTVERELRNRGLCVVYRFPSYTILRPDIGIRTESYTDEKGRQVLRTSYSTPYGELNTLTEQGNNTVWTHEYMFKSPDDYKALLYYIRNAQIVLRYDEAAKVSETLGEDFVVRDQIPYEPMQALISEYMGTESFCFEWADNRDEIMKLYKALVENARRVYPVVADGPLAFANYGGNVVPQIIGKNSFRNYYVPNYNEAAEVLHKKGKLLGCHFDADNSTIMDEIKGTMLHYIEAYDPGISPSVEEARKAWPGKVLWLNWPSSWHLYPQEQVYNATLRLIEEAKPGNGFIIGITEDVPEERWKENFSTIMDAIEKTADSII